MSLSGLVGDFVRWQVFTAEWMRLLSECGLSVLHATEILSPAAPFGKLGSAGTHEDRTVQVEPFIKSVVWKLNGVAIAVALDVEAYSRVQELHRDFTKDPHYFAFFMVVKRARSTSTDIQWHRGIPHGRPSGWELQKRTKSAHQAKGSDGLWLRNFRYELWVVQLRLRAMG